MKLAAHIWLGITGASVLNAASFNEREAIRLAKNNNEPALRHLFSTFNLSADIESVASLLADPKFNFGRYYNDLDEVALGRIDQFTDQRMICQTRYHNTIYNPTKLAHNLPIAKAIFAREGKDEGEYEDIIYKGNLFSSNIPHDYFARMYKGDCTLTMRMLEFAIDNQCSNMYSWGWLRIFLEVANGDDLQSILLKLAAREITPDLLGIFQLDREENQLYLAAYLNLALPEDDLFIRCAIGHLVPKVCEKCTVCGLRFPKINWTDKAQVYKRLKKIEKRDDFRSTSEAFISLQCGYRSSDSPTTLEPVDPTKCHE